jgi:poly [ADP-ribose] polymerase 2/3/4
MQHVVLRKINIAKNEYKEYVLKQLNSNEFEGIWGRIGAEKPAKKVYPMSDWNKILTSKLRSGYVDKSDEVLVKVADPSTVDKFKTLSASVAKVIKRLQHHSGVTIITNYSIQVAKVTQKATDEAQKLIDEINGKLVIDGDIQVINRLLTKLYTTIPRKIKRVQDSVINYELDTQDKVDFYKSHMEEEQALLDIMISEVNTYNAQQSTANVAANGSTISILDELGLEFDQVTAAEHDIVVALMDSQNRSLVNTIYRVTNLKTQAKFNADKSSSANKDTKLLFHGSRAANWYSIIQNGLHLHPNAPTNGKLFGNGIYFAPNSDKSMGYIDGGRWVGNGTKGESWLAVFDVRIGKPYELGPNDSTDKVDVQTLNGNKIAPSDCVWAKSGFKYYGSRLMRDEIIVYKEEQCTIKYLIQLDY